MCQTAASTTVIWLLDAVSYTLSPHKIVGPAADPSRMGTTLQGLRSSYRTLASNCQPDAPPPFCRPGRSSPVVPFQSCSRRAKVLGPTAELIDKTGHDSALYLHQLSGRRRVQRFRQC
ncbi:uncharacterized protein B0I36DRAFT_338308 [Microdochium trichocladiopsis]|uniref:Uncharacterized protein n=1 Tax=Microdochium trichocladiopsis TaxID=1682393 RepID=A0A9P8XS01_9PEZI|nr:uncharacterized protein B0I36DRAFT_338308 [Microdochium trichocladiopsis]KAH7014140.1 hypothetical protein B0I36DRAFT_338308 [Microdochium trichocladiopsis]